MRTHVRRRPGRRRRAQEDPALLRRREALEGQRAELLTQIETLETELHRCQGALRGGASGELAPLARAGRPAPAPCPVPPVQRLEPAQPGVARPAPRPSDVGRETAIRPEVVARFRCGRESVSRLSGLCLPYRRYLGPERKPAMLSESLPRQPTAQQMPEEAMTLRRRRRREMKTPRWSSRASSPSTSSPSTSTCTGCWGTPRTPGTSRRTPSSRPTGSSPRRWPRGSSSPRPGCTASPPTSAWTSCATASWSSGSPGSRSSPSSTPRRWRGTTRSGTPCRRRRATRWRRCSTASPPATARR